MCQNETGERPGHLMCSQPIRGGAQEAGENSLFCLQLQREAEERTWKYTLQKFFFTLNHLLRITYCLCVISRAVNRLNKKLTY